MSPNRQLEPNDPIISLCHLLDPKKRKQSQDASTNHQDACPSQYGGFIESDVCSNLMFLVSSPFVGYTPLNAKTCQFHLVSCEFKLKRWTERHEPRQRS